MTTMILIDILLGSDGFPSSVAYDAWCAWLCDRCNFPFYIGSIEASSWREQRGNEYQGKEELAARAAEWLAGELIAWAEELAELEAECAEEAKAAAEVAAARLAAA